jgi:hypothetical protein
VVGQEEILIGTAMIADRINDGDVRKAVLEKVAVLKPELSPVTESAETGMANCFDSCSPRRPL